MASGGTGSASQLAGELFKVMAGVEMTHIPYRGGGPAATNLLGGQVDVFFAPVSTVMQYIKADKLRALAVTSTTRFQELPDVPTVSDFVSGYEASYWIGLGAPKKTPRKSSRGSTRKLTQLSRRPTCRRGLHSKGDCGRWFAL
jgi:tripartite-type tricarboxylate transporter receptor subunit TctC